MGIKRIKIGLEEKIVSLTDDAIDKENCDLVEYQKSYDVTKLVFKKDCKPTFFVIKNVPSTDQVCIQSDHYQTVIPEIKPGMTPEEIRGLKIKVEPVRQGEMIIKYFKAGCKKMIEDDQEIIINDEVIETIPSTIISEIGSVIMTRTYLTDSKKK